jgi:hypothetical protein
MIQCALQRQDTGAAREVFNKMSDTGKSAPMTRYLMFKVALRSGDAEFGRLEPMSSFLHKGVLRLFTYPATECLDRVSTSTSEDANLLYACILEAQSTGDKRQAVAALQRVLEKYEHGAPASVHVPCLLR